MAFNSKRIMFLSLMTVFIYVLGAVDRHNFDNDIDDIDDAEPVVLTLDDIMNQEEFDRFWHEVFTLSPKIDRKNLLRQQSQNLFFLVCEHDGNAKLNKIFCDTTCNIDAKNEDGKTALHLAAEYGHKRNFVELLLNSANHKLYDKANLLPVECCADSADGQWIKNFMAMLDEESEELAAVGEDSSLNAAMKNILRKNLGDFDRPVKAWVQVQRDKELYWLRLKKKAYLCVGAVVIMILVGRGLLAFLLVE